MGYAIIIPDVDFRNKNLGSVTIENVVDLVSISIESPDSISGVTANFNIVYNPANAKNEQKGVTWSIVSGSQYASINNEGVLTIDKSANNSHITIKAVSNYDSSKVATKDVIVTYYKEDSRVRLYEMESSKTFDGTTTSEYTSLAVCDGNKNITIFLSYTPTDNSKSQALSCVQSSSPWGGIIVKKQTINYAQKFVVLSGTNQIAIYNDVTPFKLAIRISGNMASASNDGINWSDKMSFAIHQNMLGFGGVNLIGTIHEAVIFDGNNVDVSDLF